MSSAGYVLGILHTDDFLAWFEPSGKYDSNCPAEDKADGKYFGDFIRLISAVSEASARSNKSILVDGRAI
ncbi:MAG: hypothetical protein ABJE99_05940 [Roseobacter sp.]